MKSKILIVSIAAVLLMVLASCSSVVGAETEQRGSKLQETQKELTIWKIEERLESFKEKINMDGTGDPDDPQPTCIFGMIWVIIFLIVWILSGCPPMPP